MRWGAPFVLIDSGMSRIRIALQARPGASEKIQ